MSGRNRTEAARVVAGRYELLAPLGSGGMGTVWRARDTVLERDVAVKEIAFPAGIPDDERARLRERTRREARAAAGLHHPSAVTVFDVVEDDGAPFIVMELVESETLADVIRDSGPLPPAKAARIGLAVLSALEAAHRHGIVHRDVKPSNVLLAKTPAGRADGRVVLTDFGIATSSGDSSITSTGLILGSPSYIAPERARGAQPDPASDLWALGATLFTAVEGRPPYDAGDALATVTAVVVGDREPFVAAGPLAPVLDGLLERDTAQRLSGADARRMLEEVARDDTAATTPAPVPAGAPDDGIAVVPVGPDVVAPETAPPSAPPAAPRTVRRPAPRRARAVPLGLAALVLAGTAVGVGALALDDGDGRAADTAAPSPSAPPASTPPEEQPPASAPPAEQPPAEEPSSTGGPVPPPAGWTTSTGGPGWTVAVPPSWQAGSFEGTPEFRDPATGRTVRVSTTGPGGGKDDAVQDRRDQAAHFSSTHDDYREIGIAPIDYRGYEAADWEFTYSSGGTQLHALSRVFVVDGRGYSLFFQTRGSDDWDAARADFEQVSAAFRPA